MNREEAARVLSGMRDKLGCVGLIAADEERLTALDSAIDYLLAADTNVARSPWVKTSDRLPTEADAGFHGQVMTCYHDEWDCFHFLEKWDEVLVGYYWYWHGLPMPPEVEK